MPRPVWVTNDKTHSEHNGFAFGASVDRGGVVRIAELESQGYLYLRPYAAR